MASKRHNLKYLSVPHWTLNFPYTSFIIHEILEALINSFTVTCQILECLLCAMTNTNWIIIFLWWKAHWQLWPKKQTNKKLIAKEQRQKIKIKNKTQRM